MSRPATGSGVGLRVAFFVGAIGLLIEFLGFRILSAILGSSHAQFVAVLVPAAAGLGAAWSAAARCDSPAELRGRCAHAIGIVGGSVAATTVSLAWLSNKLLRFPGGGGPVEAAAVLLPWLLAGYFYGAAAAGLLRSYAHDTHARMMGRWLFAAAAGAVVACFFLPVLLEFGVPRSLLLVCIACGLLGSVVAWRADGAKTKRAAVATVALAGMSLLLGDMGLKPWLLVRHDLHRRRSIRKTVWMSRGAVVFDKGRRTKVDYSVDQQPVDIFALGRKGIKTPAFGASDIAYVLGLPTTAKRQVQRMEKPAGSKSKKPAENRRGRVLIVGSGGGRDMRAALANGYAHVDAIEPDAAMVKDLMHGQYGKYNDWFLADERIALRFGDGRAQLPELTAKYDRVVVLGRPRFVQAGPRLLPRTERLYTLEALREFMSLLKPDGMLVLETPAAGLSHVFRTAEAAFGGVAKARDRMFVCSRRDKPSVFLLRLKPIADTELHRLRRFCKRRRLSIEFPSPPPREGDRNAKQKKRAAQKRLAELRAGQIVTDRHPFFGTAQVPGAAELKEAVRAFPPRSRLKSRSQAKGKKKRGSSSEKQLKLAAIPAAAMGVAACLLLLLLGLLRPLASRGEQEIRVPFTLRLATPLLGFAAAVGSFAVGHWTLQWSGDGQSAWTLVVPLLVLGLAGGQLAADTDTVGQRSSRGVAAAVVGVTMLLLSAWLLPQLHGSNQQLRLVMVAAASLFVLAPFGFFSVAILRRVHTTRATATAAVWGWYTSGWALGLAMSPLVCWRTGPVKLFPLAAIALVLATLLAFGFASTSSQQASQVKNA